MNIQKNRKGKIIDERKKIKELIQERDEMNPQNDVLADQNQEQLLEIFKENLTESMNFLDSCSANEFYWISELFDDLSEYFQSQKLIECMERNAMRTGVDCAIDIEYAKKANFKGKKAVTVSASRKAKTIKRLSAKKTYYVRVKAYKVVDNEKVYTAYSAKKKVRTK